MGLIGRLLTLIFGDGRNAVRETVEVFRENAEGRADRAQALQQAALRQFGAEFILPRKGLFDRFVDGLNRLPRPALALGTLGLFAAAMTDPVWFAERMRGVALVPDPLWWLMGAIVSFYFGARHQAKGQAFQEALISHLSHMPPPATSMPDPADFDQPDSGNDPNPALQDWHARQVATIP